MGGRASGPILCSLLRWRKLSKKGVTRPNMAFIALLYLRTLDRPGKSLPKCLPLCAEQIYIFANEMANYLRKTKWRNPFFVILSGRFLHWPLLKFVIGDLSITMEAQKSYTLTFGTYHRPKRNWKECLCKILKGQQRVLCYFWKITFCLFYLVSFAFFTGCRASFHKNCFVEGKCPKCERIRIRYVFCCWF